jgi:hypothetical protein
MQRSLRTPAPAAAPATAARRAVVTGVAAHERPAVSANPNARPKVGRVELLPKLELGVSWRWCGGSH